MSDRPPGPHREPGVSETSARPDEAASPAVEVRSLELPATDGRPLAATLFRSPASSAGRDAGRPSRLAVLAPAIGVRRTFYDPYAAYLAGRGLPVLSFDYRGIGGSRRGPLRKLDADLRTWAEGDLAGVLRWAASEGPGTELVYVAHSVGTQLLGVIPEAGKVRAMLAVTPGTAYWRLWDPPLRWGLFLLFHVGMPLLSRLLGYFPAELVGLGEDLPGGVAREWSRWARHRAYMVDEEGRPLREGCRRFHGEIRAYSFSDDWQAPRRSAEHLLSFYRGARVDHRHLRPRDAGLDRVAHFGFFRDRSREALWRESTDWLLAV